MSKKKYKRPDNLNQRIEGKFTEAEKEQVKKTARKLKIPRYEYIRRRSLKLPFSRWQWMPMRHVAHYSQSMAQYLGRFCREVENCPADASISAIALHKTLRRITGRIDKLINLVETYQKISK